MDRHKLSGLLDRLYTYQAERQQMEECGSRGSYMGKTMELRWLKFITVKVVVKGETNRGSN
ncbi:conserved hypothetical protein [Ricinus communis]|uniref:Uncharacterized protein n=1 Tax=Ricinus communis TaxID=3988 RepID=B9RCR8_RICCO|nr:conserved hypothetical protein [Ricinus communis]